MSLFSICEIRPLVSSIFSLSLGRQPVIGSQIRNYAARKGTREKRRKAQVKVEQVKVGFIPKNLRNKDKILASRPKRKFDDSHKQDPKDNVYPLRYYKWPVYSFAQAIECHRETHHPDMYNTPNSKVHVSIELNTETDKKTKFLENIYRIAGIPHPFDHGEERTIIAFTKDVNQQQALQDAGIKMVGGPELIKEIHNGGVALADFQYAVAHPAILPELVSLRGLMKKKFPNPKSGTLDVNLTAVVHRLMTGINYQGLKDEYEKDFGLIETIIGTLDMDAKHLEENFAALLQDLWSTKPRNKKELIRRCLIRCPPSSEKLKVDHTLYVGGTESNEDVDEDDEEESAEPIEAKA